MPAPYDLFDYQAYWLNRVYEDKAEKIALNKFFKKTGQVKNLVDIGGGFGRLIPTYLPFASKITLTDPSEKNLLSAKKKFSAEEKIVFKKTGFPVLAFPDSSFDAGVMVRVIHHLNDSNEIIKEVSRILKPNGFFILECANKIHFLARLKAFFKADFAFAKNLLTFEQRSKESINKKRIFFLNHHPQKILSDLKNNGFEILEILSVSNFRHPIIKKVVPLKILLYFENICQSVLSFIYFGPSIFILAKRTYKLDK